MPIISDKRVRDSNGHMHVADCVITRGIVSNYLGRELEGALERGYGPNDWVPVLRDPNELKKAIDSFKDIPLMTASGHQADVSAYQPYKSEIIGTVSNPRVKGDDILADLTFWSAEDGIDPVLEGMDNLSAAYGYEIDWTPGKHNDLHYVARLHTIKANHVALVPNGRVPGARVADQKPSESVMTDKTKFPRLIAAFATVFGLKPEQATALDTALNAELGEQPAPAPVVEPTAEEKEAAEAAKATEIQVAVDAAVTEVKATAEADKKAAVDAAVKEVHALYAARDAVSNKVGVTALDSAEATYRFALDKAGVAHATLAADALAALWEATNKTVVQDSAPTVEIPNIFNSHIRKG